jgi:hypothetical protein
MISIKVVMDIMKELGVLNIGAVLVMMNTPAIIMTMYIWGVFKKNINKEYVTYDYHNKAWVGLEKEIASLSKSVEKLSDILDDQKLVQVRNEEQLKYLHEQQRGSI